MSVAYAAAGVVLLVAVVGDLLWTTLWVEGGAGPLTSRLMRGTWVGLRRAAGPESRLLSLAGPLILALTTVAWFGLVWAGWTLVFAGADGALTDTLSRGPISWVDRAYFAGYTVFTMGNGDYVPRGDVWQLATVLATGGGMLFVTLSITYVLSVLGAVTQKRSFASGVTGLGAHGEAVVRAGWDGDFDALELSLDALASELDTLTANHKAYPILHYFYTPEDGQAPTVAIAVLDDALTMLRFGVAESARPNEAIVRSARSGVENYLDTIGQMVGSADRRPPAPDLARLDDAGVPTVPPDEFEAALRELGERRRELLRIVGFDAREWPDTDAADAADEGGGVSETADADGGDRTGGR